MNFDEKTLNDLNEKYEAIHVPDSIDEFISAGMKQGKKQKLQRFRLRMVAVAACVILLIFAGTIRLSPAFAAFVDEIPGFHQFVELIRYDQGLQDAVQNDFIQSVNRSVRHQGVTFTVKNVIADNSRMILFYTLDADHLDVVNLESVQLLDKNKDPLPASVGFDPDGKHKGKITASYGPSYQLQSAVYLKIRLTERSKTWTDTVKIPLDLAKIKDMKHVLPVNQTVHFGQQAVSVEKGIVYPTRIAVYVKFDPENSKRIFGFDQLQLVDGKGQVWSSMRDGVSASGISPTERILYFESNYFREPKALFLEGHNIRALDKDKLDLVVDLKHHQLLQKPDDRIALTDITETQKTITVKLALETDPSWDSHRSYNLFRSTYRDAAGRTYENMLRSGTASTDENAKQLITFTIKKEPFQGPLTFQLMDYPNHVEKAFRVRVK